MDVLLVAAVVALAFANGANDTFKGAATLWGSGRLSYRATLALAVGATTAGSLVSFVLAEPLLTTFSGKGLVAAEALGRPEFLLAVSAGAALTVLIATRVGMPTSTTHALTGALIGAGLASVGSVNGDGLLIGFVLPLLLSPVLALTIAGSAVGLLGLWRRRLKRRPGVEAADDGSDACICIDAADVQAAPSGDGTVAIATNVAAVRVDTSAVCEQLGAGRVAKLKASAVLDGLHIASAAAVCFARAVNDTVKVAAILVAAGLLGAPINLVVCSAAVVAGGAVWSRRVAMTMSKRITPMSAGEALGANLTTAAIVLAASPLGLPVSTTHVSCAAIGGIGAANRSLVRATATQILLAWLGTLPLAALIAAALFALAS